MNLWLRLFWIYLGSLCRPRLGVLDRSVISLAAFPNDLDVYGHMNNGRYLTLMDLGRIDLILRTGLGKVAGKHRWSPLVGQVNIRYRKSLKVLQGFEIHTRILGWDEKWFYIEQSFWRNRKQLAKATVRGLFRGQHGNVPPASILHAIGDSPISPALPASLSKSLF